MRSSPGEQAAAERLLAGLETVTVLSAMWPQQPDTLLRALLAVASQRGQSIRLLLADLSGRFQFLEPGHRADLMEARLGVTCIAGSVPRDLAAYVDFLPHSLWDVDRLIRSQALHADIFVAAVRRSTRPGMVTLGDALGYTPTALDAVGRVGFEEASDCCEPPFAVHVPGDHADVTIHAPLAAAGDQTPQSSRPETEVGRLVASLIPDRATLQLGIGRAPMAVLPYLRGRTDLGLHSGTLPAGVRELIAAGTFSARYDTDHPGVLMATGLVGGGWSGADAAASSRIRLEAITTTHSPNRLLAQDGLWAINSAFEVDLFGQTNAEYVNGSRAAAGGGQADFIRAAHASPHGAAVIAMPSRANSGHARIVARLSRPHVVTSTAGDVDYVVTEYGVAALRGLTVNERAERLVAIAHPLDRPALVEALSNGAT